MERIFLVGVSHHLLNPVELPRCIESRDRALATLAHLKTSGDLRGAFLLTTCNRVEVLADSAGELTPDSLSARLFRDPLPAAPYRLAGEAAIRHLIRVASSLDSMVVGEDQILGQVKEAFEDCRVTGLLSPRLDLLLRESLRSAKEIRTKTGIAQRPVSIASVAAEVLLNQSAQGTRRPGGSLQHGARVAVLGAGEMARRVASALVGRLSARVLVVNRTEEHAARLAAKIGGEWSGLEAFRADPPGLDALVTAATCETPLLGGDAVRRMLQRSGGVLTIMDLACPPNVDLASAAIPGVRLLGLEDLRAHASRNLEGRKDEAREAERLVARAVRRAGESLADRALDLGSLRGLHEELAEEEMRAALATKLAHLSAQDQDALVALGQRLARRHAHLHLSSLRDRLQAERP